MTDLYVEFGRTLRTARARAAISQSDLGRLIGLSRASIANIEAGRQHVALDQLFDLARALDCTPVELLPEVDTHTPSDHIPGLDKQIQRHQLDPRMTSLFTELMNRVLEDPVGSPNS